jgi:hypothetical protein
MDGVYNTLKTKRFVAETSQTKSTSTKAQPSKTVRKHPSEIHLTFTIGVWKKLRVEGLTSFSLSPGTNPSIAVFLPERKGSPASSQIFSLSNLDKPTTQKQFYKADKISFLWSLNGRSLLAHTTTDVDKSNKSYYGESNLYLLHTTGSNGVRVDLDKEGPVHDVAWGSETEFGVVYGYMPAKTTVFDIRGNAVQTICTGPRNTIKFSQGAKFVLVAGFGNLAGTMDIFTKRGKVWERLATMEASNASVCEWSPDGAFILTATTSPRLRVDNGVRIWWVGGKLVYKEEMNELYQVSHVLLHGLMDRLHGVQSHFQQSKSIHWHNHKSTLPHQLNPIQTETSQPPQNQPAHTVLPTLAEQPPPPPSNVKTKVACPTQTAPPPPTASPLENA